MSAVVQWKEPPPSKHGKARGDNAPAAAEIRSRPSQWALVWEDVSSSAHASQVKSGVGAWAPAGAFDATTRKRDGRFDIYVRFIGDPS